MSVTYEDRRISMITKVVNAVLTSEEKGTPDSIKNGDWVIIIADASTMVFKGDARITIMQAVTKTKAKSQGVPSHQVTIIAWVKQNTQQAIIAGSFWNFPRASG